MSTLDVLTRTWGPLRLSRGPCLFIVGHQSSIRSYDSIYISILINKSHADGHQNILKISFPWNEGAFGGQPKGLVPIFLNDYCLVAPYKSSNKYLFNDNMQFQMSKNSSLVATV